MVDITDFENWTEKTRGLYRFVIAPGCCYEIHILYYDGNWDNRPLIQGKDSGLTAKASLYLVGQWYDHETKISCFERECLEDGLPVFECLDAAQKDYEKNFSHPDEDKPPDPDRLKSAVEENYHVECITCDETE